MQSREEEKKEEERKRGRIALDNDADIPRQQNCSRLITSEFALSSLSRAAFYAGDTGPNFHRTPIILFILCCVLEWSGVLITAQALVH